MHLLTTRLDTPVLTVPLVNPAMELPLPIVVLDKLLMDSLEAMEAATTPQPQLDLTGQRMVRTTLALPSKVILLALLLDQLKHPMLRPSLPVLARASAPSVLLTRTVTPQPPTPLLATNSRWLLLLAFQVATRLALSCLGIRSQATRSSISPLDSTSQESTLLRLALPTTLVSPTLRLRVLT